MRGIAALILFVLPLLSQPDFEVASIKSNTSGSGHSGTHSDKGRLTMDNVSLKDCIQIAFKVKDYSLNGPDWLGSTKFDIVAKFPEGTSEREIPAMMQALLADRFKLTVHRESKTLPAYGLLVAKGGPKLKEVEGGKGSSMNSSSNDGKTDLTATTTMERLADYLARRLDRPVVDETELKGTFEFKLQWVGDERASEADRPSGPSLFSALQEQVGLRLQGKKLPVEIVVIDHVERTPTEN